MGGVRATLLGMAQDGGYPQPGCARDCCVRAIQDASLARSPAALGIVGADESTHLFEASRDLGRQFEIWHDADPVEGSLATLSLTHAHLGHVDGLGLFGREVMGAKGLVLHCSEAMAGLISATPAWRQMVEQGVFSVHTWQSGAPFEPSPGCGFTITPIQVPHRAELSDNHALLVSGPNRNLLFLPDHDDWEQTLAAHDAETIRDWLAVLKVDIALLDGTFWDVGELPHRDMAEIAHPTVLETLSRIGTRWGLDPELVFIHLNHTNPLLRPEAAEVAAVVDAGWAVGEEGQVWAL